ncbi:MAG: monovalent cation/H+ antiporter subunit A [Brachymonas sp.]|nr:monovalent cation/H+ antiporter subunit A [Brachymonas sp.]
MTLLILLALPFFGSAVAALLPIHARNAAATLAAVVTFACLLLVGWAYPELQAGAVLRFEQRWLPEMGLNFILRLDGFAWMFALLVTGIGLLVTIYARYYMSREDPVPRFFSFFLAFMGAMLGVVTAGNLLQLVFFWELTSLFSFMLIGYWHHRKDARRGARMALTVTGAGGLAMLGGVILLGHMIGSYDLDVVLQAGNHVRAHALYRPALVLMLLGALTKSAQFPFHFWLPHAMAAPTPVSSYLHSATMVKAGVFLLARLWPVLSGTQEWFWIVGSLGLITLVLGAYMAMFQVDLKGLLAYSTISHLGLITLLLGMNSRLAAVAAVFHILNHATFKASLFMAAGIVDHETGTRDVRRLSGLRRSMPITATLAFVASAAMAGVPLLNGFLSKEMFFAETVYLQSQRWVEIVLPLLALVASMFATAYSLRFTVDVFLGPPAEDLPREPHEPVRWMRLPVEALVVLCLAVGMAPEWVVGPMLALAARPVVDNIMPAYSLAVWHGFNKPLVMSLLAMSGGVGVYLLMRRVLAAERQQSLLPLSLRVDGRQAFNRVLAWSSWAARWLHKRVYTHRLQPQIFLFLFASLAVATASLWRTGLSWGDRPRVEASWEFALVWVAGAACAIAAGWQTKYHRFAGQILLSGAGLATVMTFVWFSAPDLALTQLTVEVMTTLLFLLGLRWLPKRKPMQDVWPLTTRLRRARDLVLSVAIGVGMAALSYALMTRQQTPQSISGFFLERALPEGGGTNVVNVMLVDFRGFDTMGEITVLGVVALTVYALLRRFRPPLESMDAPHQQRAIPDDLLIDLSHPRTTEDTATGYLMVPAVLVRLLLPVMALVAVHLFLRGHNAPGGGFVAGLVLSIALIAQYMVAGTQWVETHFALELRRWIAWGLLIAGITGLVSLMFGYPFMTTHTAHFTLPLIGEIHFASATFFDVGVFAVVVGAVLLILTAMAHQSIRRQRKPVREEGATSESVAQAAEQIAEENS